MKLRHVMVCAVLAGCASGGASTIGAGPRETTTRVDTPDGTVNLRMTRSDPTGEFSINAPPDSVWRALALVYDDLDLHVTTLSTDSRQMGVQNVRLHHRLGGTRLSKYLSCGERLGQLNADTDEILLTLMTQVVPDGAGHATLHTLVDASAKQTGSGGNRINCATTGALEKHIVDLVRDRVTG